MTHNVVNTKTYRRDDPKLITMAAAEKLFLENPDQVKLLPGPPARSSQAEEKDAEEESPVKVYYENLNDID